VHDWDWRGAEASYRRALELAPGNALALRRAGVLANNLSRIDEALALGGRAVEQDPLSAFAYKCLAWSYYVKGELAEADAACRRALELAPQGASTYDNLSLIALARGRGDEALAEMLREPNPPLRLYVSAIIHHAAGRRAESDEALRDLVADFGDVAAYQVAQVHGASGETDRAFEWLERAYDQRDPGLCQTKCDPLLRSLYADPRWEPFLRKMGLAD
jgi:tetratricopeptide (TPR) repeat protein